MDILKNLFRLSETLNLSIPWKCIQTKHVKENNSLKVKMYVKCECEM